VLLGVGLEEGLLGLGVGDREDDDAAGQEGGDEGGAADGRPDRSTEDATDDQREGPDQDQGERPAHQPLEVEAAQVVGVVRCRLSRRARRRGRLLGAHGLNLTQNANPANCIKSSIQQIEDLMQFARGRGCKWACKA